MLYIIRHGKTDWNDLRKLQGKTNIPLNAEGIKMAQRAGEECRDIHFDVCYCSPLIRAKNTAEIMLKRRDVPLVLDERLCEMGFGIYEGTDANIALPPTMETLFNSPQSYVPDGGAESFDGLFARTGSFLREVAKPLLSSGKDVLIVGHGAVNASIICQIKGIPLNRFWSALTQNCELVNLI